MALVLTHAKQSAGWVCEIVGRKNMTILINVALLSIGLFALVKGADVFVEGASGFAARLGIPSLLVGLTIVALGTSAPEAAISIASAAQSTSSMAIAGVFGSNIINTLVILGITALVVEMPVHRTTMRYEIPFVVLITAVLLILGAYDGRLGRGDSLLLLLFLAAYLTYLAFMAKSSAKPNEIAATSEAAAPSEIAAQSESTAADDATPAQPLFKLILLCLAGAAAICVGAQFTVDGATEIARMLGMSERVVGLTIIALGTSLPELVTSLAAARKGKADMAIGNVVGSSIFNVLFVLGVSGVIAPMPFAPELLLDGVVALASVALLWFVCLRNRRLSRVGGVSLLASYAIYLSVILVG